MKHKLLSTTLLLIGTLFILSGCSHSANKIVKTNTKTKQSSSPKKHNKKKIDKITRILNKMTLDEKLGQLYFAHSTGNFDQMKQDVKKYHLGGITLFAPDFTNRTHAKFLNEIRAYQSNSKFGLLIATDQEGGTVTRIDSNSQISKRHFPSPAEIYQQSGLTGIRKEDSTVAKILKQNGINMNFAPVADVALNKDSFIYKRTLEQDYQTTAKYIPIAVKAIQQEHVASCLKHFPGYGDAADTHTGFVQINKPLLKYQTNDLLPFKTGIHAGVDSIMVSHIIIKSIDATKPASLSPAVHHLLRYNLNYHNIIITDDLQMGAITHYANKYNTVPDVLALEAGNDMLLGGNYQKNILIIKKAIQNNKISIRQINQSVKRILRLKEKLGILR
ncbi:glycoside hydrolase family 3 N-terminal domain-containing protein [Lactobacillus crispatus]|uniref:glycoside hydrolase family 3 N-terminal domain-containing protein n=1 Tax=Lactobacillus crispatus TaxID=47770 RepID=UPI000B5D9445|nr:glycoside hydrolase family 3 N-terminal domain-containing protein [Lactobacillus crispatus]OXC15621.1 beta-N-acetylhexosaminidase [Lactobacillus crispatus]OXC18005.1 beta-N-acetylhexosaminidase [Lactobacillus crispatus]OXC19032.1 beta-N-acetylhexosaminidase [Lactobacillus crispatus]